MSRPSSRRMLGLLGLSLSTLVLIKAWGSGYRSIADTLELIGFGEVSSAAALLIVTLLAVGVYAKRDVLAAGTGRRKHDIGWLVGISLAAIVVWVNLLGSAREGEATFGTLAMMFLSSLVAQFAIHTLLLFALSGFVDRRRSVVAKLNAGAS